VVGEGPAEDLGLLVRRGRVRNLPGSLLPLDLRVLLLLDRRLVLSHGPDLLGLSHETPGRS
jgi:hypothetical protein